MSTFRFFSEGYSKPVIAACGPAAPSECGGEAEQDTHPQPALDPQEPPDFPCEFACNCLFLYCLLYIFFVSQKDWGRTWVGEQKPYCNGPGGGAKVCEVWSAQLGRKTVCCAPSHLFVGFFVFLSVSFIVSQRVHSASFNFHHLGFQQEIGFGKLESYQKLEKLGEVCFYFQLFSALTAN